MNPYRILGLGSDATEIDVKRAYARLLKQHRPDTDPAGFQRVHEAYTHCLAHARYRAEYGDEHYDEEDGEEQAIEAPIAAFATEADFQHGTGSATARPAVLIEGNVSEPVATHELAMQASDEGPREIETEESSFNLDEFVDELMQCVRQPPRELTQWLHGHEALYSLQLKQFLAGPVANALSRLEPLPEDENVGIVLAFFGLDGVGQQHPWVTHSLQVLWQRMEDRREFERIRSLYASRNTKPVDRMLFRELVSPRHWLRFLAILLCPALPSRTRSLLLTLETQAPSMAQARVNPRAAEFWRLAADRDRLDWRRWLIALLRLPWILPIAGYVALVSESGVAPNGLGIAGGGVLAAWFVWAAATIGWRRLLRFNQQRLHWDMPLALAAFMIVLAIVAGAFRPGLSGPLCGLTLVFWFAPRNGGTYYAGLLAAVLGGVLVMCVSTLTLPTGASPGTWWWVCAAVYGLGSVLAHDAVYARVRDQSLAWARGQLGWLGWLLAGHAVLVVAVLIARANIPA